MWGIPLDGGLTKPQLQRLMMEVQRISEQWGNSKPGMLETDDSGVIPVKNTMALIGSALFAVLSYLHTRSEPESYVGEVWRLRERIAESAPCMARTALALSLFPTWQEIIIQEGGRRCDVEARWTLERDTPDARIRLEYNAALCAPVLSVQRTHLLFRQMALGFTTGAKGAHRCMDVVLGFGGEKSRAPGSRLVKPLLTPYAPRRVYLPEGSLTEEDIQTAVADMYALFCMYLVQERFISAEDDLLVREFLFAYLRQSTSDPRTAVPHQCTCQ